MRVPVARLTNKYRSPPGRRGTTPGRPLETEERRRFLRAGELRFQPFPPRRIHVQLVPHH
jgi:hypothetical protein